MNYQGLLPANSGKMNPGTRPNIILVLSDQHRGDFMSHRQSKAFVDTPNMDRMAESGLSNSRFYCNAPLCGPSQMSLLTGLSV